jgi:hypothetical protein
MIEDITAEIRLLSRRCSALARECSDRQLSNALEVLAFDFALTASEFVRRFGGPGRSEGAVMRNATASE